jgi:D-alanine-D-alanine ligase
MSKVNLMKLRIGVLMGGLSSERAISLLTGRSIIKTLKERGHRVIPIDIDGRSFQKVIKAKIDVAVLALHGTYGEDGVTQGILEFLGIPYTGSGVMASAIGMNKVMSKQVFDANKIPTPRWAILEKPGDVSRIKMKFPLVFKPCSEGSAVGVTIVKNRKQAAAAYKKASKYGNRVLIEKYIKGVEISVPVLGSDRVLPVIEIVPANEFYDYQAKYTAGRSTHIIPARLSAKMRKKAGDIALRVHNALMCRDYSRTDMIAAGGGVYVLETNTLPGMTSLSLYPEAAKAAGIGFYDLLVIFIKNALERKV